MKIRLKGTTIILSESPTRDVLSGIMVRASRVGIIFIDAKKGQKEYGLSHGITKKDDINVYLRMV